MRVQPLQLYKAALRVSATEPVTEARIVLFWLAHDWRGREVPWNETAHLSGEGSVGASLLPRGVEGGITEYWFWGCWVLGFNGT